MSLNKLIEKFGKRKRTLFTTPSHNQGEFIIPKNKNLLGKKVFEADFSEIEDFDNFANPEGVILESQKKAAEIYGSKYTFYLTNGSTSGIIAAMNAILSENDKVLIARNCHKSVYSGLVITGAHPVWLLPDYNEEWGIFKAIKAEQVEKKLAQDPNIKAFIITNPTYEGVTSSISKISEICKKYNVILIVDEAHGALWSFDGTIGTPAIRDGADISVQSLHKTAGALNPSAVLHVHKEFPIDVEKIQCSLNLINTTSPPYPILANIENTVHFLSSKQGKNKISELIDNVIKMTKKLSKYNNIFIYSYNNDITKILVKINGLSGYELSDILFNEFKIEDELSNEKSVLLLTGIGTSKEKLKKLEKALIRISKETASMHHSESEYETIKPFNYPTPQLASTPRKILSQPYKSVKIVDAIGKICHELIMNYPPGVPIIIPGEVIQEEHITLLNDYEYIKVLAGLF